MTVWMFHEALTPEDETRLQERTRLTLPFDHMPDLSMINSAVECRHLMQALNPDDPPETVARKSERVWKLYAAIHEEDVIAVPLPSRREVAVAEVTQRYHYSVDADGHDVHQVVVTWHDRRAPFRAFKKHAEVLERRGEKINEIVNPEVRTVIRDRLPHAYNRFVKWKWLLALIFLIGLFKRVEHLLTMP